MTYESRQLAFYLDGRKANDADLYVMINTGPEDQRFIMQQAPLSGWKQVIDTSRASPADFCSLEEAPEMISEEVLVEVPIHGRFRPTAA